jgi:hypothetical protein
MAKIIISYRRSDSAWTARSIFDRLTAYFGSDSVFMDIDNVPFGIDFREHIESELQRADAIIVVVGPGWTGRREGNHSRIHDENDPVRIEVETALRRRIPVIPVLVDDSRMPTPDELPDSLRSFSFRNAAELNSGRDFHSQMDRLIRSMDRLLSTAGATIGSAAAPSSPISDGPTTDHRSCRAGRGSDVAGVATRT